MNKVLQVELSGVLSEIDSVHILEKMTRSKGEREKQTERKEERATMEVESAEVCSSSRCDKNLYELLLQHEEQKNSYDFTVKTFGKGTADTF